MMISRNHQNNFGKTGKNHNKIIFLINFKLLTSNQNKISNSHSVLKNLKKYTVYREKLKQMVNQVFKRKNILINQHKQKVVKKLFRII